MDATDSKSATDLNSNSRKNKHTKDEMTLDEIVSFIEGPPKQNKKRNRRSRKLSSGNSTAENSSSPAPESNDDLEVEQFR